MRARARERFTCIIKQEKISVSLNLREFGAPDDARPKAIPIWEYRKLFSGSRLRISLSWGLALWWLYTFCQHCADSCTTTTTTRHYCLLYTYRIQWRVCVVCVRAALAHIPDLYRGIVNTMSFGFGSVTHRREGGGGKRKENKINTFRFFRGCTCWQLRWKTKKTKI